MLTNEPLKNQTFQKLKGPFKLAEKESYHRCCRAKASVGTPKSRTWATMTDAPTSRWQIQPSQKKWLVPLRSLLFQRCPGQPKENLQITHVPRINAKKNAVIEWKNRWKLCKTWQPATILTTSQHKHHGKKKHPFPRIRVWLFPFNETRCISSLWSNAAFFKPILGITKDDVLITKFISRVRFYSSVHGHTISQR